ncbi:MAG: hypothetical protein NC084_12550 [Bacteroides sp.]|nr:hypothetical protein [Eubacterium sp.]MCM1417717.1 hypothetical protein [Roseburia sp.]MCM1463523.1 hypothetical protein [Bacteroides sp.]
MKVFIGGARQIHSLDQDVTKKLNNILTKGYDILVGDANGIDASVQKYYYDNGYRNVTIYASNGKARNNVGNWEIQPVKVDSGVTGFDFYAAKDLKMAQDSDCGFMIWNGKSRGTWNNVLNLCDREKLVVLYVSFEKRFYKIFNTQQAIEIKKQIEYSITSPRTYDGSDHAQLHLF